MAAFGSFYQRVIDFGFSLRSGRNDSAWRSSACVRRLLGASIAAFGFVCAGSPAADAANFTCSWNDATANWTTVADWSNCNGTFPNNGDNATISQGNPTLTTPPPGITLGSVTINSP